MATALLSGTPKYAVLRSEREALHIPADGDDPGIRVQYLDQLTLHLVLFLVGFARGLRIGKQSPLQPVEVEPFFNPLTGNYLAIVWGGDSRNYWQFHFE
ncbi:hypothetical protein KKF84_10705 [Myxococcota bacterium]|nr:hypothetical protein [Myxococcota bacterium]MBU1535781.1 hypothetical protein [Myxococcota bacterium]